jgi:tetratricopeptide (TPR) repeat protein
VDARSQQVVWSDSFNGKIDDIFELRTQIVRSVAVVAEYRLAQNESEILSRTPSENLDAWGHYHRGIRAMFQYKQTDNEIAQAHFERAVAIDPEFARAHAALSYSEFQNYFQQFGRQFEGHKHLALAHAEKAVRHDPFDPYCNLMLGRAKWLEGSVDDGLDWVERSLSLAPNYSFAFYNSALLNAVVCDGERAETHVASALSRSPVDPHIQTMLGTRALAAFVRRDRDEALRYADQAMLARNAHPHVYLIAAGIQGTYGETANAMRSLGELKRKKVNFRDSRLAKHFDLRDEERKSTLFGTLESLEA